MLTCLVFHAVEDGPRKNFRSIRPSELEQHLRMISRRAVRVVNPESLGSLPPAGQNLLLTFDDATADHARTVAPMLESFGLRAVFYVPTAAIGRPGRLSNEQVASLASRGHLVGSHSHHHKRLDQTDEGDVRRELRESADRIESLTGQRPVHFAAPGGAASPAVGRALQAEGFQTCRTLAWGWNRTWDPLSIEAIPMTSIGAAALLTWSLHAKGEAVLKLLSRARPLAGSLSMTFHR